MARYLVLFLMQEKSAPIYHFFFARWRRVNVKIKLTTRWCSNGLSNKRKIKEDKDFPKGTAAERKPVNGTTAITTATNNYQHKSIT